MSMKNKIRRAFEIGKPDVLGRVLEDCPDPQNNTVIKRKKRLSDRTAELIATAASIALLIGAVFGGAAYFRGVYAGPGDLSDGESTADTRLTTSPEDPTVAIDIDPLPTVDYDNSMEGLIMRTDDILYPLELRDSIYEVPDIPVETIVEDGVEKYQIIRDYGDYIYLFKFRVSTGELLSLEVVVVTDIHKDAFISPYAATWIALMDLAPQHYGGTQHCEYNWTLDGEGAYRIEAEHYTYIIDGFSGKILDSYTNPDTVTISQLQARDIALGMWGHYIDYVHCLKISENSDFYTVYYEQGEYAYEFHIGFDGSVIYDAGATEIGLRAEEQMAHLIGWEKARSIALSACGRDVTELIGFTYEYFPGDPDYYHLELYFPDKGFTYRIGTLEGELLEGPYVDFTPPEGCIDIEKATQIALEYTGRLEDYLAGNVADLACKFDEYGNPAAYYIYFRVGSESFEVGIDATGEVLFCNGYATDKPDTDNPYFYSKEDATQVALSALPMPDTYPVVECHQIGTEPNRIIYMVVCRKPGMSVTTMVDGNTLRIMDYGVQNMDGVLTEQQVRTIAYRACGLEEEGPAATAMLGIFNDGIPFYCAKVYWDEMVHVVVMDAKTGEVLNQSKFENTRIPGHILTEDQALEYALANAFISLVEAIDPIVEHDADSKTYTVRFWYQGDLCTVIVDDYYGSVIDMYWTVDE